MDAIRCLVMKYKLLYTDDEWALRDGGNYNIVEGRLGKEGFMAMKVPNNCTASINAEL